MKYNRIIKMKYKEYPRTYEKVYTAESFLNKFDINAMTTDYKGGKEEYQKQFANFFRKFDRETWMRIAEYYWLQQRFFYNGKRKNIKRSCIKTSTAFSTFIKHNVGHNYLVLTSTFLFGKALSYFRELYGSNTDKISPFDNPEFYEFPYKNIGLAHLTLVYQMDERLDLLRRAEEESMSYFEFLDFVINYTYCVNDEMGKTVFSIHIPTLNIGSHIYVIYHFRKGGGMKIGLGKDTQSSKSIRRKPYENRNKNI